MTHPDSSSDTWWLAKAFGGSGEGNGVLWRGRRGVATLATATASGFPLSLPCHGSGTRVHAHTRVTYTHAHRRVTYTHAHMRATYTQSWSKHTFARIHTHPHCPTNMNPRCSISACQSMQSRRRRRRHLVATSSPWPPRRRRQPPWSYINWCTTPSPPGCRSERPRAPSPPAHAVRPPPPRSYVPRDKLRSLRCYPPPPLAGTTTL
jgi:hypothetical protein